MNRVLLTIVMIISLCVSYATIDELFSFNASIGTYTPIVGTVVSNLSVDDALSAALPIGFTFVYGSNSFTQVRVSSNGWVGLGTSHPNHALENALASTLRVPVIAPLWDDLSMAAGDVQYLTTGSAPNRVFTVQFTNARWNFNSTGRFNFQARLFENGQIDLCYGASTPSPNSPSASIGINIAPGGSGWFYSVTPATSSVSTTVENNTVNVFPDQGTIYSFSPIIIPDNDLAALSLNGNNTPSLGVSSVYTAQIRCRGNNPQTTYVVKLFSAGDVELASVYGPAIQPDQVVSVDLPWTPSTEGITSLYAKVFLIGDQEPENDQTPDFGVTVLPPGVVTIGDGYEHARMPFDMFYKNSLYQAIYFQSELGQAGTIDAIALHNQFNSSTIINTPIKVWIGNTTATDLSSGWIPSSELTLVYDDTLDIPEGQNIIYIPFLSSFTYTGANLVLMFHRPLDTTYYSYLDLFRCQTQETSRARNYFSDSVNLDPTAPLGGTITGQFPKTSFYKGPMPTEPVFTINPMVYNFGDLSLGQNAVQIFRVSNSGAGTLTINSITISGANAFTLSHQNDLPISLSFGESISFVAIFSPETLGNSSATININYANSRLMHSVSISGTGVQFNAEVVTPHNLIATVDGNDVYLSWEADIPPVEGFFDDFESYDDFLLDFPPWTCVDVDLSSTYSITGYTWPNAYAPQAYIIWNSSATTPPWGNPDAIPYSGSKQVACFSSFLRPPNNDWLISPPLEITSSTNHLSFWAKSLTDVYGLERFKVGISTTGDSPSDFTIISGANYIEAPSVWTPYVYDLSSYMGQRVRFAIQCVTFDAYIFFVDDVALNAGPENLLSAYGNNSQGSELNDPQSNKGTSSLRNRSLVGYRIYRNNSLIGSIIDTGTTTFTDMDLLGGDYSYGVTSVYSNGESFPVLANVTIETVNLEDISTPAIITMLAGNYPNPFNPVTKIQYSLKEATAVRIEVYNVKGQMVKTLVNGVREPGSHSVLWTGVDNNGRSVSSGVYFYKMTAGKYSATRKMILMK